METIYYKLDGKYYTTSPGFIPEGGVQVSSTEYRKNHTPELSDSDKYIEIENKARSELEGLGLSTDVINFILK